MNAELQDAVTLAADLADTTPPTLTELALEALINDAHHRALLRRDVGDVEGARASMLEMAGLIRQRTSGQVRRLEMERGLR